MDALSEILGRVTLNGALYFTAEFSAPWGLSAPASKVMAARLAPGAPHLVLYHLVVEGGAYVAMADGQAIALGPGDVVVFPHGDPHTMSDARATRPPFPNYGITAKILARDLRPLRAGGGGAVSRLVCGYMTCEPHPSRPILDGLPSVFKVNVRSDASGHWLENSILHLVEEAASGRVGSEALLTKVSEALFVDTLRRYIDQLPPQQTGWLAGSRDPVVGRTLALMHSRVAHPWTIAALGDEVGLSRSALVERFRRYLAEPPIAYLTRWRLHLAAESIRKTTRGLAEVAAEVGYESEAAFNRAFKKEFGQSPGRYRTLGQVFPTPEHGHAPVGSLPSVHTEGRS